MTPQYKRVLLKLSGEMLGKGGKVLSDESLRNTAERIKLLHDMGVEIGIVVGGGNIMRGRSAEGMDRNRADHMGMLSTAINSLALQDAIERAVCRVRFFPLLRCSDFAIPTARARQILNYQNQMLWCSHVERAYRFFQPIQPRR